MAGEGEGVLRLSKGKRVGGRVLVAMREEEEACSELGIRGKRTWKDWREKEERCQGSKAKIKVEGDP